VKPYERPGQQSPASLSSPPENPGIVTHLDPDSNETLTVKEENDTESENALVSFKREPSSESSGLSSALSHGLNSPMMPFFGTEIPEASVRRAIKYCESLF
jgi:hypothetical protein